MKVVRNLRELGRGRKWGRGNLILLSCAREECLRRELGWWARRRQRARRVAHQELGDVNAAALARLHHRGLDDLDRALTGAVAAVHLLVELVDGADEGGVAELLVHVVGAAARVVAEPDAVVLHVQSLLLVNLGAAGREAAGAVREGPESVASIVLALDAGPVLVP